MSDDRFHLVLFPCLYMGRVTEVDFDFASVWNLQTKLREKVPSIDDQKRILKITNMYMDPHRWKIRDMGIMEVKGTPPHEWTVYERNLIHEVQSLLFLCRVADSNTMLHTANTGHYMATAENFDVALYVIVPDSTYITFNTGTFVPSRQGGLDIAETRIVRPRHIPTPNGFRFDNDLLRSLLQLRQKHPRVYSKIITACDIFRQGYYNDSTFSENARILLQMAAFEIVLELPEAEPRRKFKELIGRITNVDNEPIVSYLSERPGDRRVRERGSVKQCWADAFYALRNRIIHGENPRPNEFLFRRNYHRDISLKFFVKCIQWRIERSLGKELFDYEIRWEKWNDRNTATKGTGFLYELSLRRAWLQEMKKASKRKTKLRKHAAKSPK